MEIKRVSGSINLALNIEHLGKKIGKVGWFQNSKYNDKDSTPVAAVAAQNEFGNPNKHIPARPFMRPTIAENEQEWRQLFADGSRSVLKGNNTITDVLDLVGKQAVGQIKRTISRVTEPPLSPRTIQARLSRKFDQKTIGLLTKPLIDTGIMLNTVINVVETE